MARTVTGWPAGMEAAESISRATGFGTGGETGGETGFGTGGETGGGLDSRVLGGRELEGFGRGGSGDELAAILRLGWGNASSPFATTTPTTASAVTMAAVATAMVID